MTQERESASPCGLYCGACPLNRAASDRAFAERLAQRMGRAVEEVGCIGCRPQKGLPGTMAGIVCETYDCCVNQKGLEFCYQCDDFPCLKLFPAADRASELPHNTKVYNLMLIQKRGVESLAKEAATLWRLYFQGKKPRPGGEPQT